MGYHYSARDTAAGALRAEMARQRKTSLDLARALGISQSAAGRRMNGNQALDVDEIDTIASWLDVPPHRLLGAGHGRDEVA